MTQQHSLSLTPPPPFPPSPSYALELGDNVGSFTRRLLPAGSPLPTDVCLHMEVTVERAGSGTPVTDLDMYLGAAAHILVVNNVSPSAARCLSSPPSLLMLTCH